MKPEILERARRCLLVAKTLLGPGADKNRLEDLSLALMKADLDALERITEKMQNDWSLRSLWTDKGNEELFPAAQKVFEKALHVALDGMPWINPKFDMKVGRAWDGLFAEILLAPDFILELSTDGKSVRATSIVFRDEVPFERKFPVIEAGMDDAGILGVLSDAAGNRILHSRCPFVNFRITEEQTLTDLQGGKFLVAPDDEVWTNPRRTAFMISILQEPGGPFLLQNPSWHHLATSDGLRGPPFKMNHCQKTAPANPPA